MRPSVVRKAAGAPQDGLESILAKPGVCADAGACRVVWGRVKGYPPWPVRHRSWCSPSVHVLSFSCWFSALYAGAYGRIQPKAASRLPAVAAGCDGGPERPSARMRLSVPVSNAVD